MPPLPPLDLTTTTTSTAFGGEINSPISGAMSAPEMLVILLGAALLVGAVILLKR